MKLINCTDAITAKWPNWLTYHLNEMIKGTHHSTLDLPSYVSQMFRRRSLMKLLEFGIAAHIGGQNLQHFLLLKKLMKYVMNFVSSCWIQDTHLVNYDAFQSLNPKSV
jgi:hypothetical protein